MVEGATNGGGACDARQNPLRLPDPPRPRRPRRRGAEIHRFEWYEAYGERHADDLDEGRLVSLFRFEQPWTSWEMHPEGEEVVCCIQGHMTLHQQLPDGSERSIDLGPGDYAINPRGAWHTADADGPVTALFITPGKGTTNRPR